MTAGAFGNSNFLALQVGNRLDRRFRTNQDGLRRRRRRFFRDVSQLGSGRLRKQRHGIGDVSAKIDIVGVDERQQSIEPQFDIKPGWIQCCYEE